MLSGFQFLDYIWRGLFLGATTSTIFVFAIYLSIKLFGRARAWQIKWYINVQFLMLIIFFVGNFIFIGFFTSEIALNCFNNLIKQNLPHPLTRIFATFWLIGVTIFVGYEIWRLFKTFGYSSSFLKLNNSNVRNIFEIIKLEIGVEREIELLVSPAGGSPFVYGIFSPKIVLPQQFLDSADKAMLRDVIAHEVIHVRDNDLFWCLMALACRCILFFHPLIYLVSNIYRNYVEFAADEEAVKKCELKASEYVQSLIAVSNINSRPHKASLFLWVSRGFIGMKQRIQFLLIERAKPKYDWYLPFLIFISSLSVVLSAKKAESVVLPRGDNISYDETLTCTQLDHEKIIKSWLKTDNKKNKSGM